jgi:methionyl-tRNA formyltransferase
MKIVFMGTPEFAVPTFEMLASSGWILQAVFTAPDKPRDRMETIPTPVGGLAERLGLPLHKFPSLKKDDRGLQVLRELAPDVIVVVAYGRFLPKPILDLPRLGCVNLHPSLLPLYRGPSPVPAALLAGDGTTGVTTMLLDEGMDTGPLLMQEEVAILPEDNAETLSARLADLGARLMERTLRGLEAGTLRPVPQDGSRATVCKLLEKEEGALDWREPAAVIHNKVRAYAPWPGTFTTLHGKRLKVLEGRPFPEAEADAPPGTILQVRARGIDVATGRGVYQVTTVKLEGKNACPVAVFICGHRIIPGEIWL